MTFPKKYSFDFNGFSKPEPVEEPVEEEEEVGRKDDREKLMWHLLPWRATSLVVSVLTYGARKYAPENWRKVSKPEDRYFSAAIRHLTEWRAGQKIDPESGLPHLAHAACSLLFILDIESNE